MPSVDYPYDFEANRGSIVPEDAEDYSRIMREKEEAQEKAESEVGFWGGIKHSAMGTVFRIETESSAEPGQYTPTKEEQEEILKAVDYEVEPAKAIIRNLSSKEDIPIAIKTIKENLEYNGYEAQADLLDNLASGLGDALADPVNLALGVSTGGLGAIGRVGVGAVGNVISGQMRESLTGVESDMVMDAVAGLAIGGFFEGAMPASRYLKNTFMETMGVQSNLAAGKGLAPEFFESNFVGRRLKSASSKMMDFFTGRLTPFTIRGMVEGVTDDGAVSGVLNKTYKTEAGVRDPNADRTFYRTYGSEEMTAEELLRNNEDLIERFNQKRAKPTKRLYARGLTDDQINEGILKFLSGKETGLSGRYNVETINDFKAIADDIKVGLDIGNSRDIARGAYKEGAIDKEFFFPRVWDRNKIADLLSSFGTSSLKAAKKMLRDKIERSLIEGLESDIVYMKKMFEVFKRQHPEYFQVSSSRELATTDVSAGKSVSRGGADRTPSIDMNSPEFREWLWQQARETALGVVDQGEGLRRGIFDKSRPEMPLKPEGRLPWNTANRDADGFCLDDLRGNVIDTYQAYMRRNMGDYIAHKVYGAKDFNELSEVFKKAIDAELDTNRNVDRARLEKAFQIIQKRLYGMGLRDYDEDLGFGNAISEVLRNLTFATANTYMGILNYTEMSAAVLAHGPMMLLKSVPGLGRLFHRFSKGGMTREDEDLIMDIAFTREPTIKNIWGDIRRTNRYRYGKHRILADIVSGSQYMANALPTTKFLQASQVNIVDTARGAMLGELIREAKGLRKGLGGFLRKDTQKRLSISAKNYSNLMNKLDEVFDVDEKGRISFRDKKRAALALMEDYDTLMTLRRLGDYAADETILRNHLADTFNWDTRSSPLIGLLAQFKSFALRSYSKRLVKAVHRGMEGDAIYQGANFSISVALATLGNLGITYARTTGMSEDDKEKYWEMALGITPDMDTEDVLENAVATGMLRSSILATPALFLNAMGVGTLAKTTSDARSLSWDEDDVKLIGNLDLGDLLVQNIPALRTGQNWGNLAKDLMNLARISLSPDDFTYEQEQSNINNLWKSIKKVTPQWGYMTNAPLDFYKEELTTLE